jgi:hypothetical protein
MSKGPYRVAIFDWPLTDELVAQHNSGEDTDIDFEVAAHWDEASQNYFDFEYPTWRAARQDFWRLIAEHYRERDLSELVVLKKTLDPNVPYRIMPSPPEEELLEESRTRKREMVNISFKKKDGHTYMVVDARELQAILDSLGAVHRDGRYMDRPVFNNQVVDASTHKLSSEVFLIRPGANNSLPEFDLTAVYNRPISKANLETLGESAEGVVRMILDHYQPVDITVDLRKKVVA